MIQGNKIKGEEKVKNRDRLPKSLCVFEIFLVLVRNLFLKNRFFCIR